LILGLLFVGTIVACVMVVGAQIFPTVVEYQAVESGEQGQCRLYRA
jgi:hypothetical protein